MPPPDNGPTITGTNLTNVDEAGNVLPIDDGGTGETSAIEGFDALSPSSTKGDLIAHNGTDNVRLPVGADDLVLTADATTPEGIAWKPAGSGGGTITEVVAGVGLSGGGTSGVVTVDLETPVSAANGGTGVTTGLTVLDADNLASGTLPDATFPAVLPAVSGANLTGVGDVDGPASATDNAIARFDLTTGKLIQGSGITIADAASGTLAGSNSGDITLAGTLDYLTLVGQTLTRGAIDLVTDVSGDLPYANLTAASAASRLFGRGSAAGAGDWQEITLGTGVALTGTVLSATGTGGDVVGPASATDNAVVRFNLATGKLVQNSLVTIADSGQILAPSITAAPTYAFGATTGLGINGSGVVELWIANDPVVRFTGLAVEVESALYPLTDNTYDLGLGIARWKDGYFSGNLSGGILHAIGPLQLSEAGVAGVHGFHLGLSDVDNSPRIIIANTDTTPDNVWEMDAEFGSGLSQALRWFKPGVLYASLNIAGTNGGFKLHVPTAGYTERNRTVAMGEWTNVPFNAANFGALGGGTWVVTAQNTYAYQLVGKTMTLTVATDNSTIAGLVNPLFVIVPGGFLTAKNNSVVGSVWFSGAGVLEMGLVYVTASAPNTLQMYRPTLSAYPAGAYRVGFTATFEIQ